MEVFKNLIILLFFIILNLKAESIPYFKSIYLSNNHYFIIKPEQITYYNSTNDDNNTIITTSFIINLTTEEQKIKTSTEQEMISLSTVNTVNIVYLLSIKNFLYAINYGTDYFCNVKLDDEIKGLKPEIYGINCDNYDIYFYYCYFVVGIVKDQQIKLFLYGIDSQRLRPDSILLTYNISNVASENVNCQLMQFPSYGIVLTCFYQKENSINIEALSLTINDNDITIFKGPTTSNSNNKAKIIKSVLSIDKTKSFICYINNNTNIYCLTYDITNDTWSEEKVYLNYCKTDSQSSTLNIEYFNDLNQYFLYCFQSETKFVLQKLDSDFNSKEDDDNGVYDLNDLSTTCSNGFYLSSLVHNINNIQLFISCDNNILKYKIKDSKIQSQTTIITTLPITTILTTFPESTISSSNLKENNYSNKVLKDNEIIYIKIDKKKEDVINEIDNALEKYDVGVIYEIFGDDYSIKINPINAKTNGNISTYINFANCENILREKNGLNSSSILIVYQIEIYNNNPQSLINNVEYAVFKENGERLDLSVCDNELIEINYQINTSIINKTKVNHYSELGIDVFNIKDKFFNDICYSFSEGDSDMILSDRVADIYQNYSVCEENCNYNKINLTDNTVSCKCSIKENPKSEVKPPKLDKIIRDTFEDSNLAVMKCYNLVFNFINKSQNIGFLLFSILIFFHIPFIIHYAKNNISSLRKYIYSQLTKFHYYYYQIINPPKKSKKSKNKRLLNFKSKNNEYSRKSNSGETNLIKTKSKKINQKLLNIQNNLPSISIINSNNQETLNNRKISNKYIMKSLESQYFKQPALIFNYKVLNQNCININGNNKRNSNQLKDRNMKKSKELKTNKIILSPKNYSLIQIDANNYDYKTKPINSDFLLDYLDYDTAIKYDKRSFFRIFYICILAKENVINIIFFKTPLDIYSLRVCLFIFNISCDLAFNTIFYTNQNISDKYHYHGKNLFLFTLVNNILQTILSLVVGLILVNIFQYMIDSRGNFEEIFRDEEKKLRKNKKYIVSKQKKLEILQKILKISSQLKCKAIFFIIFEIILMLYFYYFVTAFCEVYKKIQKSWLYEFIISFFLSLSGEIIFAFLLAILYVLSIKYKSKFIYNIVIFFYNI